MVTESVVRMSQENVHKPRHTQTRDLKWQEWLLMWCTIISLCQSAAALRLQTAAGLESDSR